MVITQYVLYPTLSVVTKFQPQVCARSLENNKIGGIGETVEVDDIEFTINRDVRKDRKRIRCRLFAAVNVGNQEAVVVYYGDPDVDLPIEQLMRKHVLEGTLVTHKGKEGYENLQNMKSSNGSNYYEINEHLDCLPNLERLFVELRSNVGRKGLHASSVEGHINRYMYWKKNPRNTLHHLLLDISCNYNINDQIQEAVLNNSNFGNKVTRVAKNLEC